MAVAFHTHTFEIPTATDADVAAGTRSDVAVVPANLGTASQSAIGDFATAAQGGLADSAVQPGDLGDSAGLDVGTSAGTVAAGDDSRITGAAQKSANLSDLANASTARTNLGLAIGTNVQAQDAGLQSISGLTTSADQMIYTTGSDAYATTALTAFGRSLLDDANDGAARTTLGLGGSATLNVGTTAGTVAAGDDARIVGALQPASPTATGVLTVGASPYPDIKNSVTTTANHTNASANITVANGSQVANGDTIIASFVSNQARVISGGGTNNLVMSHNATATGTGTSVQFGNDRWDLTAAHRANTGGFENVLVGQAAKGRSTWFNQVNGAGLDYSEVANFVSINPNGAASGVFGTRMSDENTGLDSLQTIISITYVDTNPNSHQSWGHYEQANLMVGATPTWHANKESSVESFWPTVDINPFNMDATGSVRGLRIDAGIGTYAGGAGPRASLGAPEDISAFIDFPNNDARARAGIVFGSTSLDTDSSRRAPALALAPSHAVTWYGSNNDEVWSLFVTNTTGDGYIWLEETIAKVGNANFGVTKAAGQSKNVQFMTDQLARFSVGVSASAESGSNVGSDFVVSRFADAGTFIAVTLQIRRSNGRIAMPELATSTSYASDAAAAAGGVQIGELYRNGSQVMIRIT